MSPEWQYSMNTVIGRNSLLVGDSLIPSTEVFFVSPHRDRDFLPQIPPACPPCLGSSGLAAHARSCAPLRVGQERGEWSCRRSPAAAGEHSLEPCALHVVCLATPVCAQATPPPSFTLSVHHQPHTRPPRAPGSRGRQRRSIVRRHQGHPHPARQSGGLSRLIKHRQAVAVQGRWTSSTRRRRRTRRSLSASRSRSTMLPCHRYPTFSQEMDTEMGEEAEWGETGSGVVL